MRSLSTLFLLVLTVVVSGSPAAHAALAVVSTVPEWAALAKEIGGAQVNVTSFTSALQDPHHIDARPSLIARARNADLLLATGAELEVGWLPVVQRESGNPRLQDGRPGYFEAAAFVRMLDIPGKLDRADGDVHAAGNPHIQTDPRNLLPIGEALAARLAHIDPANAAAYRAGYAAFATRWREQLKRWEAQAAPLKGVSVVSQHKAWAYLYDWVGLREVATLEPKPGIEPSLAHLARVRDQVTASKPRMVIRAAYSSPRATDWFSQEARVPAVVLPFTVGAPEAEDLSALFEITIQRLLKALK
jgi:zinc/manganese transport system substrate-binding protein